MLTIYDGKHIVYEYIETVGGSALLELLLGGSYGMTVVFVVFCLLVKWVGGAGDGIPGSRKQPMCN